LARHLFAGFSGIVVAVAIPIVVMAVSYRLTDKSTHYTFEPRGQGSFEPRLANYVGFAQYIIGLATGSLALAAGSSILKSSGVLHWRFASPLTLLGASVIYGVCFIALINYFYEGFLHDAHSYKQFRYNLNNTFGFSCLLSFAIGYMWLAVIITKSS